MAKMGIILLLSILGACTTAGIVAKDVSLSSNEAVFVLGVSPSNYSVGIWEGEIQNGVFLSSSEGLRFGVARFLGPPTDGYIVGKAKSGQTLGITLVQRREEGSILVTGEFVPCGGTKTPVFSVPSGKVIYLGDITYTQAQNKLRATYSSNEEAARRYVSTNFPNLADKPIVRASYELLPTDVACSRSVYFPIYVR